MIKIIHMNFEAIKITENVYWVGAIDWELRDFHGYHTQRGTTYNAYLIMGEKPILIDTVKAPFYQELMARISSVIDPAKIKYIISNHAEMDHSGCLPQVIEAIKPEKVFASKMGAKALKEHFQLDYPITEITDGEQLTLGNCNFAFVETKMLHWPDSMFTYFANDSILFSQDGLGMHLATSELFAEENDPSVVRYEASKYYANILLPYSNFVSKLIAKLPSLKLAIKMVAPDHGPIWRRPEDIKLIIDLWDKWSHPKETYLKAVIVYDTMWQSTAKMAHSIADGFIDQNVPVKVLAIASTHRSDIITELLEAGAFLVGSPTINQQMFPTLADTMCYLKGLKPHKLIGQAFGSYGWAEKAVTLLQNDLKELEVELVGEAIKSIYVPTTETLTKCRELGQTIAKKLYEQSNRH
jgi:flavorubredoxin